MERFVALSRAGHFALPGALAEGTTFTVPLPKRTGRADLFEPPPYWKRADDDALRRLQQDITAVLELADPVIQLDFWVAGRRRDAERDRPASPGAA
jgi:hypothetical protein